MRLRTRVALDHRHMHTQVFSDIGLGFTGNHTRFFYGSMSFVMGSILLLRVASDYLWIFL
jgi:hypothetical protein